MLDGENAVNYRVFAVISVTKSEFEGDHYDG